MKMTLDDIDAQIREVENRIAVERIALHDAVNGCTNSLREAITSPKTLLALLGILARGILRATAENPNALTPQSIETLFRLLAGGGRFPRPEW